MSEQNKEEILELDVDQLQDLIGGSSDSSDTLPPFQLELEDFDVEEFKRGIKDTSYIAGVITAFLNAGVTEGFALDFLLNKETIKHNLKTAEITKEMNIEMSKNQKATAEKYEL
jgi:hypothetical protein